MNNGRIKTVFLTGASGFLGSRVLKMLLKQGYTVKALARSEGAAGKIRDAGAVPCVGDILDIDSIVPHLGGIDAVVHCAAPVEFWGPWKKYQTGIIDATIGLAHAAQRAGVKRFVHVSSESVMQERADLLDIDETTPYPKEPNSYYGKSKKLAEEGLKAIGPGLEVVILRPTFIWGVGCTAIGTILGKVRSGQWVWIDHGKYDFEAVHVDNVVESIRLAVNSTRTGIYFVTDREPATVKGFMSSLMVAHGLPVPEKSMPKAVASIIASAIQGIWRLLGIKSAPMLTPFDLAFVAMSRRYNVAKIVSELGYNPVVTRAMGFAELKKQNESTSR